MPGRVEDSDSEADSDDVVMRVLEELEDMLFEPCTVDGEAWNRETKAGKTFREEVRALEVAARDDFAGPGYRLEQTEHHRRYCALVERHCDDFLRTQGYDAAGFVAMLRRLGRQRDAPSWKRAGATEIVNILLQAADFELFARDMAAKAATSSSSESSCSRRRSIIRSDD